MRLDLVRFGLGADSTLGKLHLDGIFQCFTLEDERRQKKVKGETCIPEGEYVVELRTEGGFHQRYRNAFPDLHKGMLWIRNVPGFEYILLHCGNTDEDSAGCVLVGARPLVDLEGEFELRESQLAYKVLYPRVVRALDRKEKVTLHVWTKAAA